MTSRCLISTAATVAAVLCTGAAHADATACATNFTVEGSFLSGKSYKTWQEFSNVSQADAYRTLYSKVVSDGMKIASSDKEMGVISASQDVSYGEGKTAPLNVLVESARAGSKVTLIFKTSGAVMAKASTVQGTFCGYLAAVEGSEKKE